MLINIAKANHATFDVAWDELPEVSKNYIIRYGLTQALNDAHASIKATDDNADEKALALAEVRLKALLEGNPPSVGARAQSKPEWYAIAEEMLGVALRKAGTKKKDVKNLDEVVRKLYALKQSEVDAEVNRRKASGGVDLSSLGL